MEFKNNKVKFIFITGGVTSSLGKGLTNASLGKILTSMGYKIKFVKFDPYLNIDPGTMNPNQHGEVYVMEDGTESDLDFGHYERFTNLKMNKSSSITAGKIYSGLLEKERRGEFLGKTVQTIPHVTNEIQNALYKNIEEDTDFILCEIGGTVGDMEALPFLEAIRQVGYKFKNKVMYIHMTLVPYLKAAKELKTKPTQHSVRELRSIGIQPDILICRSEYPLPNDHREKIANFCNMSSETVIPMIDSDNIYDIPLSMCKYDVDKIICEHFALPMASDNYLEAWESTINNMKSYDHEIKIGIIGKYTDLDDSYKSLFEAISHAGIKHRTKIHAKLIDSRGITRDNVASIIKDFNGIIIPGGFGNSGISGKIEAIKFARENNVPLFGICMGMQLAVIEAAQNLLNLKGANSTELDPLCEDPIVCKMNEWLKDGLRNEQGEYMGGTMRLGAYGCHLSEDSLAFKCYQKEVIFERHRHRYEFNNKYKLALESVGIRFTGVSIDNNLMEIVEIPSHRWFLAVQFHPEFQSGVLNPHPIFSSFVENLVSGGNIAHIINNIQVENLINA